MFRLTVGTVTPPATNAIAAGTTLPLGRHSLALRAGNTARRAQSLPWSTRLPYLPRGLVPQHGKFSPTAASFHGRVSYILAKGQAAEART